MTNRKDDFSKTSAMEDDFELSGNELALNYGELIQEARQNQGLNRKELAETINMKKSHLKNIENEKMQPDIETQDKIEDALDIDLSGDFN